MRKNLLLTLACGLAVSVLAQAEQPTIYDKFQCLQLSGNGEWMLGRSNTWYDEEDDRYDGETSLCNVNTGQIFGLADYFTLTPYSRPISSKGVAILSTNCPEANLWEVPYLIVPGEEPKPLLQFYEEGPYKGKECYACAITDDASAFLAYYEDYPTQYPFVCTLSEDFTIGTPDFLPLPAKDIFGGTPLSVQLTNISDDANTVGGLVWANVEKVGLLCYPIVYTKGSNGTWAYSYPLMDAFDVSDPEKCPNFYASQVALSPDGTLFACTQEIPSRVSNFPDYKTWVINLKEGTYKTLESSNTDIVATRILNDGTVIGTFFATINISYVYTPYASDYVDFQKYAADVNPPYGQWIEDNLMVKVQDYDENGIPVSLILPNTGQVFVSDDFSVFAAGFQESKLDEYANLQRWSYAFTDFEPSSVKTVDIDNSVKNTGVYNLYGIKIAETDSEGNLPTLPQGIYIVNGKKVIIK